MVRNKKTADSTILTVKDVSEYLRLSKITVYKLVRNGKIPGFRVGGSWRFKMEKIKNLSL